MGPILEQRWNALQLGSQVKGAVWNAISSVVHPAVSTTRTFRGGQLDMIAIRSGADVDALVINGDTLGGGGGHREARAVGVSIREMHLWKQAHAVRFLRIVFTDGSEISGGVRGAGAYKGLRFEDSGGFRVRYSESRVLDISVDPSTPGGGTSFNQSAAKADRPPSQPAAAAGNHGRCSLSPPSPLSISLPLSLSLLPPPPPSPIFPLLLSPSLTLCRSLSAPPLGVAYCGKSALRGLVSLRSRGRHKLRNRSNLSLSLSLSAERPTLNPKP
ncbi:hypothetical protein T484DRAFT_3137849 [Baffinella frigidus]|nr:hypothetical protein T484DRAFT_3137849 [Cryptophyta sp. CCMP2293]